MLPKRHGAMLKWPLAEGEGKKMNRKTSFSPTSPTTDLTKSNPWLNARIYSEKSVSLAA